MAVKFLVSELIDNHESAFHIGLPFVRGDGCGTSFETSDKFIGCCIIDTVAELNGAHTQSDGKMGFSNAGWAKEQDILTMFDELTRRKKKDTVFINRRLEGKIKGVQHHPFRKTGKLQSGLHATKLAILKFIIQNIGKDIQERFVMSRALLEDGIEVLCGFIEVEGLHFFPKFFHAFHGDLHEKTK